MTLIWFCVSRWCRADRAGAALRIAKGGAFKKRSAPGKKRCDAELDRTGRRFYCAEQSILFQNLWVCGVLPGLPGRRFWS